MSQNDSKLIYPSYYLVSGRDRFEFMSRQRFHKLYAGLLYPEEYPNFIVSSIQKRLMVICVGCDFLPGDPTKKIFDYYRLRSSKLGGLAFTKVPKNKREDTFDCNIRFLQDESSRRVFAILHN